MDGSCILYLAPLLSKTASQTTNWRLVAEGSQRQQPATDVSGSDQRPRQQQRPATGAAPRDNLEIVPLPESRSG